ncbi:MAG: hypothetical protein ACI9VT_002814, partial [Psychroserpens sp.]
NNIVIGNSADEGVVSGKVRFSLGGTLEITNAGVDLVAGQAYPGSFDIVVVYE